VVASVQERREGEQQSPEAPAPAAAGPGMLRSSETEQLLRGFCEVNGRCIEMLVHAARHDSKQPFALVAELRAQLIRLDPRMRQRAAAHAFLLVDFEFSNADWWHAARAHSSRALRGPVWRGAFARESALQLAVATLMFAWNSIRTDAASALVPLGMTRAVAEIIASLRFEQVDRIARKRFAYARPRWEDRPAVWRRLLAAVEANDAKAMGAFRLHAVQLLTGDLLPARSKDDAGPHPSRSSPSP
jgi:urease accessory protein UreF